MDICLLPQSDDIVGWVRTTGKLPLYLACNRYVLASDVGEASWILRELDPNMLHRPFPLGSPQYAEEIASRLRMLLQTPSLWEKAQYGITVAREHFEYAMLARRVCNLLDTLATKEAA
jgi:hypothetical protein